MKAKAGGGGKDFEPVAAGTYPSRLVGLVDIGLQPQKPYKGVNKPPVNKVVFIYEMLDEFLVDDDGNDMEDKPRWQSETMAFYSPEATQSKIASRYNALDPTGSYDGDYAKLVGDPCLVTITHSPKEGGGVWTNVESIAAMRPKDAEKAPALVNDGFVFDTDEPDMEVFDRLPAWIKKMITGNLEFKASKLEGLLDNAPAKSDTADEAPATGDDEVPY